MQRHMVLGEVSRQAAPRLRQDEVQVAKLVPAIVLAQGLRVREAQVGAPGERLDREALGPRRDRDGERRLMLW
jgi:hypothetical protein